MWLGWNHTANIGWLKQQQKLSGDYLHIPIDTDYIYTTKEISAQIISGSPTETRMTTSKKWELKREKNWILTTKSLLLIFPPLNPWFSLGSIHFQGTYCTGVFHILWTGIKP